MIAEKPTYHSPLASILALTIKNMYKAYNNQMQIFDLRWSYLLTEKLDHDIQGIKYPLHKDMTFQLHYIYSNILNILNILFIKLYFGAIFWNESVW